MSTPRARKPRRSLIAKSDRWYEESRSRHEATAIAIPHLLRTVLAQAKIDVHDVRARVKTKESFLQKAQRPKYKEPWKEIQDVVGIRVITHFESSARAACEVVEREFEIDRQHSLDKSAVLGTDRVGYRSHHYIARLSRRRCGLPEYALIENLPFEIQVRSVLQHAWAEIEHDRRFKYDAPLPPELSRRFSVLAGVLELADREFDEIARELDRYAEGVAAAVRRDASRKLEVAEIAAYLASLFQHHLVTGHVEQGLAGAAGADAIEELRAFGVTTLGELAALVTPNLETNHPELFATQTTFIGILRDAMIVRDARRYFERAFAKRWHVIDDAIAKVAVSQGVSIEELRSRFELSFEAEVDDDEEA